jgi:hypothetical protein
VRSSVGEAKSLVAKSLVAKALVAKALVAKALVATPPTPCQTSAIIEGDPQ